MSLSVSSFVTGISDHAASLQELHSFLDSVDESDISEVIHVHGKEVRVQRKGRTFELRNADDIPLSNVDAFVYFVAKRGFDNTLMTPQVAYDTFKRSSFTSKVVTKVGRDKLYELKDFLSLLTEEERTKVMSYERILGNSDKIFYRVLSCFLSKAWDPHEPLAIGNVPLVKTTIPKQQKATLKGYPEVVKGFLGKHREVMDFFVDDINVLKASTSDKYRKEITTFFKDRHNLDISYTFFQLYIGRCLQLTKPFRLSYDDRTAWVVGVVEDFSRFLSLFFSKFLNTSLLDIRPYVVIEDSDALHELSSYLTRLSSSFITGNQGLIAAELASSAVCAFILQNKQTITEVRLVLIIILIYYSVYGTNSLRIVKRPGSLNCKVAGRDVKVLLSGVEDILYHESNARRVNAPRVMCRAYADITLLFRLRYSIYRNNWRNLCHVDGRLAFDTVNFAKVSNVPAPLRKDYYEIVKFINNNTNNVAGVPWAFQSGEN
nr:HSP90 [Pineapple mealybug wilt-associated virus 6]